MPLVDHPSGNYRFLPGIAPYSCGVVSSPGYEIVHVRLREPVPYRDGFDRIEARLKAEQRPLAALCGIELRSPRPFTFEGFAAFNADYAKILEGWGIFVDGVNPVARTNVAPVVHPPEEPCLYGFSFTRPCEADALPTFVVAGAGELPEGVLERESIVRLGEIDPDAIAAKARFVMDLMEARLSGLEADWDRVTSLDIYTIHPIHRVLPELVLARAGAAAIHGAHWYHSCPPIFEIEYEMDMRGVRTEIIDWA